MEFTIASGPPTPRLNMQALRPRPLGPKRRAGAVAMWWEVDPKPVMNVGWRDCIS